MKILRRARTAIAITRHAEELLYERALDEFEAGHVRRGLWAQALGKTSGNEAHAKGVYLKLRVRSMIDEGAISDRMSDEQEFDSRGTSGSERLQVNIATSSGDGSKRRVGVLLVVGAIAAIVAARQIWNRAETPHMTRTDNSPKAPCFDGSDTCNPWNADWNRPISGSVPVCRVVWDGAGFSKGTGAVDHRTFEITVGSMLVVVSMPRSQAEHLNLIDSGLHSETARTNFFDNVLPAMAEFCR